MKKQKFSKFSKQRLVAGMKVKVIAGDDKNKVGVIKTVLRELNAVIVEGVNIVKRSAKINEYNSSNFISREKPINISNVAAIDEASGSDEKVVVSKIGYKTEGDKKVRIYKKSGKSVEVEAKSATAKK